MDSLQGAGWYWDPDDAEQIRYWDGVSWTDDRFTPLAAAQFRRHGACLRSQLSLIPERPPTRGTKTSLGFTSETSSRPVYG